MEQASYSFDVRQEGDTYHFSYEQAQHSGKAIAGYVIPVLVASAVLSFAFMVMTGVDDFGSFPVIWLLFSGGLLFLTLRLMNRGRGERTFALGPRALRLDGRDYDRAHITSLYIDPPGEGSRNAVHLDTRGSLAIAAPMGSKTGAAIGAANAIETAAAIGRAHRDLANWKLGFRYGEKDLALAEGLSENTATLLFERLTAVYDATRASDA